MTKLKVKRSQLKTAAQFFSRSSIGGSFEDFLRVLEETFEPVDPEPKNKKYFKFPDRPKRDYVPKGMGESRNSTNTERVIHRGTPKTRTICGNGGWDCITTEDDSMVTCQLCKLPKNQKKLLT